MKSRISIELVPRGEGELDEELAQVREAFPFVDTVNIPDLLRFPVRSWEGCAVARRRFPHAIPHIRAIDLHPRHPLPMAEEIAAAGINEVLVVTGDPPQDMSRRVYPTSAIDLIKKFKSEMPQVKVYAALDPYRSGFRKERDYLLWKLDAGADGFFTQPFFDIRLMDIFAEIMTGIEVFWGVSPVTSEKSQTYWETRNQVVFPADFTPTLAWNRAFAGRALQFARDRGANLYFMPIRLNVVKYLEGVLVPD